MRQASTPELLAAWKPRTVIVPGSSVPAIDIRHSYELVTALTAEIEALGFSGDVAKLAAGAFVNCQDDPDFGLIGSHNDDPILARQALEAVRAWASAQSQAQREAA